MAQLLLTLMVMRCMEIPTDEIVEARRLCAQGRGIKVLRFKVRMMRI